MELNMKLFQALQVDVADIFVPMKNGKYGVAVSITDAGIDVKKNGLTYHLPISKKGLLAALSEPQGVRWNALRDGFIDVLKQLAADTKAQAKTPITPAAQPEPPVVTLPELPEGKVHLRDAQALHQPVFGTSEGSTYFVAGLKSDLKCACRIHQNGTKMSIRVEGNVDAYSKEIAAAGLNANSNATTKYASVHLDTSGVAGTSQDQIARRTLGAVLFALGSWDTSTPDLAKLEDK
jgi:hypothetical protein